MRIGLCAKEMHNGDIRANLKTIRDCMEEYAGGVDFLCFGEAFLQGFDGLTWNPAADVNIAASPASPLFGSLSELARECGLGVTFGYMEREGTAFFSSYAVIGKDGGLLANFRRVSKGWKVGSADPEHYREGSGFPVFTLSGMRTTVGLCGDLWDDRNAAAISSLKAQLVLWPVYLDYRADFWNGSEAREYAKRSALFGRHVLLVNSVCEGEGRAKGGAAHFLNGKIAEELPAGREGVLLVTM